MKHAILFVAAIAPLGCSKHSPPAASTSGPAAVSPAAGPKPYDELQIDVPPGESDLTVDGSGKVWAIAERDRVASEIALSGHGSGLAAAIVAHPVEGVPDGNDTESIAWLGGAKFALGIEGQETETAGVLYADLRPDGHLVVTRKRMLTADEMGVKLQKNHGAEAICGTGDDQLVGIEERGKFADGSRWAPIVRLAGDAPGVLAKLRMTTDTGKLSALDCRFAPDGSVDFVGIERHYGVERILHGVLPAHAPAGVEITPTVELDLGPSMHDAYNIEGIARLGDGRWVLVNDNQSRTIDGPTKLFVFERPPGR